MIIAQTVGMPGLGGRPRDSESARLESVRLPQKIVPLDVPGFGLGSFKGVYRVL